MSKQARIGVSLEIDNLKELEKNLNSLSNHVLSAGIDPKDAKSIEKLRQTVEKLELSVEALSKGKLNTKTFEGVGSQIKTMATDIAVLQKELGAVVKKIGDNGLSGEFDQVVRSAKTATVTTNNLIQTTSDLYNAVKKVNKEGVKPVSDVEVNKLEKLKNLLQEIQKTAKNTVDPIPKNKDESLLDYLTRLYKASIDVEEEINNLGNKRNKLGKNDELAFFDITKQKQDALKSLEKIYDVLGRHLLKDESSGKGELGKALSERLGLKENLAKYFTQAKEDAKGDLDEITDLVNTTLKDLSKRPKVSIGAASGSKDGISVPVYPTQSPNYTKQLQAIIDIAQDYALKNPVRIQSEVEVKLLSPYLTNKNKRILEEIRDGLSEVEDEEIKTKVADLIDVINTELNPEVKIGISVDTRKAYAKISYAMEAIKKKLEETKLVLSPELEFSKITDDKIKSEFDKALSRQKVLDNFDYLNNLFDKNSKMDASGVKSAAKDIGLVKESGEKLGENFGEGYAEGVTKSSKKVKKSSKKMIKEDVIDTAAETQDSHSPSKVAEQLGVWFDEGYAEGIAGGADKVADAIAEMIQNNVLKLTDLTGFNVPGAEEGVEFFEEIKAGIEKYISSIKPKFQNLYNTLDNLTNMWWAMKNIADNIDYEDVPATKQIVKNLTDAFDKYKQLEDGLKLKSGSKNFIDLFPPEQLKALDKIMKTPDNGLSKIKVDAENIEEALRDVVDTAEKSSEIDTHEWIGDFLKGEQEYLEALEKSKEAPKEVAKANKEASKEIIKANESIVNPVETVSKNVVDVVEETSKKVEKTVKKTVKKVQEKIEDFKPKKALFDDFVVPPSQYSSPNSYGDAFSTRHQDSYFGSLIPKLPLPSVSESPKKHSDIMSQFVPDSFADAFSTRHQDKYFDSLINHLQSVMAPLAAVNNEVEEVKAKTEEVTKKASEKAKEVGETVFKESEKVKTKVKEATKSVSDEAKKVVDETKNLDKTIQDLTFLSDEAYYRGDIEAFKKYEAQIASLTGRAREATKGFTDLDKAIEDTEGKKGIGIPLTERATVDREKEAGIYAWATEKADELAANLGEVLKIERQMDSEHESYIVNYENGMAILGKESESQLLFTRQELYNRAKLEKIDKDRIRVHNQEYKINQQIAKQTESYYEYYSKYGKKMEELLEGAISNPLGNTKEYTPEYKKQLEDAKYELMRFQGLLGTHKDGKIFTFDDIARLDEFKDKIDEATKGLKDQNNVIMKSENLLKLYKKVNKDLNDNTAMPTKLRNEYEELQTTLRKIVESGEEISAVYGRQLTNDFLRLSSTLEATGRTGNSLFRLITKAAKSQTAQLIARYFSLQDLIRYARQAFDSIRELDTALIDLRKTTSMSGQELEDFYYDSNEVARSLGVTTRAIIEQAAQWSRLGYSSKEASIEMAKLSSQFASISPGMETADAQTGLVSIMKAWDVSTDNVEREIMDTINTLGNRFAETNADIIEGMERSGAAFAAMGEDMRNAFALFTGAQEIVQASDVVGTALKTLSLRLRGYDEETEQLSDDVVIATGKVADLTKTASNNYNGISLWKDADQTQYKSIKDYLGEIAAIWDEIDAKDQTQIIERLFGKRGAAAGSAILGNFDQVEKALVEMENSAGAADAEMDIIRDSIDFKINNLKEVWTGTFQDILKRDDLGKIIDALAKFSEAIGGVIDKIGLLGTAGVGVGAFLGVKHFEDIRKGLKDFVDNAKTYVTAFNSASNITSKLTPNDFLNGRLASGGLGNPEILKQYTDAIKGLDSEEANLILTRMGLNEQTKLQILSNAQLLAGNQAITAQVAEEIVAQNILSQEDVNLLVNEKLLNLERIDEAVQRGIINAETADAIKLKLQEIGAVEGLTGAQALLNAEFLKTIGLHLLNFIKSPIGILLALAAAVAGVVAIVKTLNVTVEEQIEIAKEAHKKAQESKSDYEQTASQLEIIRDRIKEINSLPNISLTQEDELSKLYKEAAVLANILQNKKDIAEADAKQAMAEDVTTYYKKRTAVTNTFGGVGNGVSIVEFEDKLRTLTWLSNRSDQKAREQYAEAEAWIRDELDSLLKLKQEMDDIGEYVQADYNNVYEDIRRIYEATEQYGEYNKLVIADLLKLSGIVDDNDLIKTFGNQNFDEVIRNNLILNEGLEHLNFLLKDGETSAEIFKKYIDDTLNSLAKSGKFLKGYVTNFDAVLAQIVRFEDDGSTSSALEYFENQMSTISGYVEKIKSGTFSNSDLLAVQKLGVKGTLNDLQSIQDQLEKMMSGELKEVYEQITQIIEGNKLSNDVEKKLKDLQKSLVGIYDEAKKISKIDTFSQQLDNLYKLNEGLSQLSEVYKDVIDPESTDVFDYSKILGNDGFKKAFQGLPGSDQYKAYEEFIKTVTTSPADIKKSQEAFNNLVTEYVYASGALDGLNEENAEATELYLKQNGIINAHEVIVAELAKRQAELAANTLLSNDAKLQEAVLDLKAAGAGWNKITSLINEANATNEVKFALYNLIAQQTVFNNQNLNTTQKITALNNLAEAYAGLIDMERYEIMMNALRSQGLSGDQLATEQERILKQLYDEATKYSFKEFLDFKPEDLDKKGDDFKETIDWIETKLARIDRIIENLGSKADDTTVSWGTRIKALNKEIGETTSELDVLAKARDRYLQEANSVALSASYKRKVRNGTIDIEKITDEALKDSIEEYRENYEKYLGIVDKITEKERELRNLEVKRFDNEVAQHEERVADLEYENSLLENQIAIYGAKGYNQTIDQYKKQNEQVKERINLDKAELEVLKKLRKESGLSKTSEAYKEMTSRIRELNTTIAENTLKIQENNKAIGESLNEASNFIQSRYDFAKAEQDFLRSLIKEEDYFNKVPKQKWSKENAFDYATAGMLTNEGRVAMASYFSEMELNKKAMEKENADWKKLLAVRYEGKEAWHNPEFIAYYEEHKQRMQELVSQNQEYKDSIIDMVKNGINVELDSIKSLIDQYDKALDSQKDLYDYQKNVEKQTKDITKLRKQLAAYEGDTSEENKARVQRLKVSLAEAEEGLRDTEYERELSQQKSMLDDLYTKYSNMLTEFISEETDSILNKLRTSMDGNYDQISTDIQTLAEKNGYNMSIFADRLWNNPESIVYGKVSDISTGVDKIVKYLDKVDNKNTGKVSTTTSNSSGNTQIPGVNGINPNAAPIGLTAKTIRKVPVYSSSNGGEPMFYTEKGETVTILPESNLSLSGKDGKKPYYVEIVSKKGVKRYGWIAAKTNLEGYRSGVHNLTSDKIAWTQENGSEAIIRPSDGAILTPLKSGDSVLTSTQTENLFGFAKDPLEFLRTVSGIDVGNVGTKQLNNVINNDMNFSIELPNVSNYEEFVYQMQHDKKFEVMIRSMTTDRLFGKSAMNKYKI